MGIVSHGDASPLPGDPSKPLRPSEPLLPSCPLGVPMPPDPPHPPRPPFPPDPPEPPSASTVNAAAPGIHRVQRLLTCGGNTHLEGRMASCSEGHQDLHRRRQTRRALDLASSTSPAGAPSSALFAKGGRQADCTTASLPVDPNEMFPANSANPGHHCPGSIIGSVPHPCAKNAQGWGSHFSLGIRKRKIGVELR